MDMGKKQLLIATAGVAASILWVTSLTLHTRAHWLGGGWPWDQVTWWEQFTYSRLANAWFAGWQMPILGLVLISLALRRWEIVTTAGDQ